MSIKLQSNDTNQLIKQIDTLNKFNETLIIKHKDDLIKLSYQNAEETNAKCQELQLQHQAEIAA